MLRPSRSIQRVRSLGHMGIVKLLTDLLRKLLPIFSLVSSDTISEKRVKTRSLRASILSHLITLFCVPLNIQPATLGGQHISQQGRNQNSPATEPQRTSNPWIQCSNIVYFFSIWTTHIFCDNYKEIILRRNDPKFPRVIIWEMNWETEE